MTYGETTEYIVHQSRWHALTERGDERIRERNSRAGRCDLSSLSFAARRKISKIIRDYEKAEADNRKLHAQEKVAFDSREAMPARAAAIIRRITRNNKYR